MTHDMIDFLLLKSSRMLLIACFAAMCGNMACNAADIWPNSQSARGAGHYPASGSIVWLVDEEGSTLYGARKLTVSYKDGKVSSWGYDYIQGHLTIPSVITGYIDDEYVEYRVKTLATTANSNSLYQYLTSVTVSEGIEAIYGSFAPCSSLSSATLPSTLREIGNWSFSSCTNLAYMNIPASLENIGYHAFYETRISSVALPNCCTNVGSQAFAGCTNLVSLNLGKVKSLESNAFSGCTALSHITIPASLKSGDMAFNNCTGLQQVAFEEGLENISHGMFYGCNGIKEIILPEGLKNVANSAFWHCTGAEKIVVPLSVTNVNKNAFSGCEPKDLTEGAFWYGVSYSSVTNFTLLPGPALMESKFSQSTNLQKITFPDTIKEIAQNSFKNCTNLQEVIASDSVERVGNNAFFGCSLLKECPLLHSGSVTNWGTYVFSGCTGIEELNVPGDIKTIPQGMFNSCTNLKEVVIEEGVETISPYAFYGDSAVEKIVLPSTATNMNSYAGMNATNLKVATFNELHPPKNIISAFLNNFSGTAYYPPQYADEWAAALASVGGTCKSWADASETDPGEVEVDGVAVSYGWLAKYGLTVSAKPEVAATAKTGKKDGAGKEMSVVDDYIAGTDPTNPDSRFTAIIDMSSGAPAITYDPDLNTKGVNRVYTIYGTADLNGEWVSPTNSTHRFFKVEVSMP